MLTVTGVNDSALPVGGTFATADTNKAGPVMAVPVATVPFQA